jgi:hypothetical protein
MCFSRAGKRAHLVNPLLRRSRMPVGTLLLSLAAEIGDHKRDRKKTQAVVLRASPAARKTTTCVPAQVRQSAYPRRNGEREPGSCGDEPQHPAAIRSGSCGRSSSLGPEGATREVSRDENDLEPHGEPRIGTGQCVGGQGSRRRRGLASATWRSVDRCAGASGRAT